MTAWDRTRVVVADDDVALRAAVCAVLEDDGRFQVVAQAGTGTGIAGVVELAQPRLVLVDVGMTDGGAVAVADVLDVLPDAVVVVLSARNDPRVLGEALAAGARGYLLKGTLGGELGRWLTRCLAGEVVVSEHVATSSGITRVG
jgi:two-component system response regulator DesR